jgi:ribosome-associated heat shock protein Hsp15
MAMLQNHQRSFPTDKITFRKDQITQIITVLDIPDNRVSAKLVDIYRRNDTPAEAYQHLELLKLSKEHYRKMVPADLQKKDRRDIDEFGNEIKTEEDNF